MAAIALVTIPLLKGAVPVFVKIAAGGCWGSLVGQVDQRFLADPQNNVTAVLHDWLKPAIDNAKDHISKVAKAEFLACMDKLQNGIVYLTELEGKQSSENRISDLAVMRESWNQGRSELDDKEMEQIRYWFRKAHSSALKLSYNTQLELSWRLETMSIVLFCMAFEHIDNPERLIKSWRRQLAEFLKDAEIQHILDSPSTTKFRDNLNTIREICYLVFVAVRQLNTLAIEAGANTFEGYKLFVQNMAYGNSMEQVIVLTNMAWECGVIGKKTRIVAYDAEKVDMTSGGRLTIMKREADIQFIFNKSPLVTEIENDTHRKRIVSIAGSVVNETPLVCIADESGDILYSWANRILFSDSLPSAPIKSENVAISISDGARLFAAVVHSGQLHLFETLLNNLVKNWRTVLDEPEKWDGSGTINLKAYCSSSSHVIHLIIYEKYSGWYGQTVLCIEIDSGSSTVVGRNWRKVKCAFGSRKQRFAFCLNADSGGLIAANKERPNTKGGTVGVKMFGNSNYDKPEEEQTVKPQSCTLRDIAACETVVALAFYM